MCELLRDIVGFEEVGRNCHAFGDDSAMCCDEDWGSAKRMDRFEFWGRAFLLVAFIVDEGIRNGKLFEEPKDTL